MFVRSLTRAPLLFTLAATLLLQTAPFDPSVTSLPPNFGGTDLRDFVDALEAREKRLTKDEFETTAQFRERAAAERAKPLHGSLREDSLLTAVLPVEASYDADRTLMTASVTVERVQPFVFERGSYEARFEMEIPKARRAKPGLRALVIFNLAEGAARGPSRVPAVLRGVWFFDHATGEVFSKKAPAEPAGEVTIETVKAMIARGEHDNALAELRSIIRVEPNHAEAYFLAGQIYYRGGDVETAINQLKTSIFWDKTLVGPHILLGRIFLERGDVAQARAYSQTAMQLDPNNPEAIALSRRLAATVK